MLYSRFDQLIYPWVLHFLKQLRQDPCINAIKYVGRSESKERFAIQRYLLIIGKKQYAGFITHLHLLLHIVTLDTEAVVVPWHQFTYSLLVPEGCLAQRAQILQYCKCSVTISYTAVRDTSGHCLYTSLILKCQFSWMMWFTFCFNASVMTEGRPDLSASWTSVFTIPKHCAPFSDTGPIHNMFTIDCDKSSVNFTGSNIFNLQKPNHASHLTVGGIWYRRVHCHNPLYSQREKFYCTNCTR